MKKITFSILLLPFLFLSCTNPNEVKTGIWRGIIPTNGGDLAFNFEVQKDGHQYTVYSLNADDRLKMDSVYFKNDSIHIPIELFDAELIAKVEGDKMNGVFHKIRSNRTLLEAPFKAEFGKNYRFFDEKVIAKSDISGKYAVTFITEDKKDTTVSVGIFTQKGNAINGTFLTPTGDYRYLSGNVSSDDSLYLSCYEGNHVFLFKAKIEGKELKNGEFWSNINGLETWNGVKDDNAKLPDANSLTYLKEGYKSIEFSFKNQDGKNISLTDERYKNKVVIVQLMGSWCPNCMDETKFLSAWYKKNKQKGVEIIALAYEKSTEPDFAYPKIKRLKERFGIEYEVLIGGINDKAEAAKTLPMLNKVLSFPTTIFIDRKGIVRQIHTGFSGPGTGVYYDEFVSDFNTFTLKLSEEGGTEHGGRKN
jgi:thiol-disulfide isomerase/thioredoxin